MSQQPKTETDRLSNVIQVLQLGQKTGRLIVERDNGPYFEQGIITFVNGQVVQASSNQQQGLDAFNLLKSWGACRFSFTPESRPGHSGITGQMPGLSAQQPPPEGARKRATGSTSTSPLPNTPPGLATPQPQVRHRTTRDLASQYPQPDRRRGENLAPPLTPMGRDDFSRKTPDRSNEFSPGGARQLIPTAWLATPYRTRPVEEGMRLIEHMSLSRTHRRLFLLIDGSRTVKELIRLMSHDPEDVQRLLRDLEHAGVIQV